SATCEPARTPVEFEIHRGVDFSCYKPVGESPSQEGRRVRYSLQGSHIQQLPPPRIFLKIVVIQSVYPKLALAAI
ncbi:MAG TPA: hypothetical protein VFA32_10865, partial [Dehalococcoidia bacterium]|nr:hypothetical protein [Dehalococcoidia bacterium]